MGNSVESAQEFRNVFLNNRSLIHIDLSNNHFKSESIKIMSIYLQRGRLREKSQNLGNTFTGK